MSPPTMHLYRAALHVSWARCILLQCQKRDAYAAEINTLQMNALAPTISNVFGAAVTIALHTKDARPIKILNQFIK